MTDAIITALVAALASISVVAYTQYREKKLKYFDTYFNRKLDAYSGYWKAIAAYEESPTSENYIAVSEKLHLISLFAPDNVWQPALFLTNDVKANKHADGGKVENLIGAMRADLENCKKMRF